MKIKSIKKIKNIGLLDESSYTSCDLFTYLNKSDNQYKCYSRSLVKGNNGTGKSTFSNLLYSIEKNQSDILYKLKKIDSTDDMDIEIELEDGTTIKYDNIKKEWTNTEKIVIKVFNEDYVKDNINFDEFDKTNEIKGKYETEEVKLSIEKNNFEKSKKELEENKIKQQKLKQELENKKNALNIDITKNYDSYCKIDIDFDNLNTIPNMTEDENTQLIDDINKKSEIFNKFKAAETFKLFSTIDIKEIDATIKDRMLSLLTYIEDTSKIDFMNEILKESEEKRAWIDTGLTYIDQNNLCPFCKTSLESNNIIDTYNSYKLSKIKENEIALNKCKDYFNKFIEYRDKIIELNLKISPYIDIIKANVINLEDNNLEYIVNQIVNMIDNKLTNMQCTISDKELEQLENHIIELNVRIVELDKVNQQASEINKKMTNSKTQLSNLRKEIKELKIQQFNSNNLEQINSLILLKKQLILLNKQYNEANKIYNQKLLDANIVIKEINDWLKFFGLSKYVIDDKFNLNFANKVISNKTFVLSTGELSIIAFSYFLTTLTTGLTEDEKMKLVIVIDDPVNSIDYNNIYSFATILKTIQNKISKNNNPQLFIFTHNILLYNILVQSTFMKSKNAGIFELYKNNEHLCIKKTTNSKDTIFINYLKRIIAITQNEDINVENVVIYNCIRTVLENFKYLLNPAYSESGDDETIKDFFQLTDENYAKLDYIINHNSHNEPELNCEPWFDDELLKNCCIIISDMVKNKYFKLYEYCIK